MKTVLVLGTGMVAGPAITYLLALPDLHVRVASLEPQRARQLIGDHPRGTAQRLDAQDRAALRDAIAAPDVQVVISLLPYTYHVQVAELCIAYGKHLITTSYVTPAMEALDAAAQAAGVTLLNEIGVDPGIDHMSALRVIRRAQAQGGEILHFRSWCGGLPAPEANTNPLGYKFSWSPRGVLLAGRNPAHYREQGQEIRIPAGAIFAHRRPVTVPGMPPLEGYPNRDALPYAERYGIPTAQTVFRGTLRYPGWCAVLDILLRLGFLELEAQTWPQPTLAAWTGALLGLQDTPTPEELRATIAARSGHTVTEAALDALAWLGLFSAEPLPLRYGGPIDVLTACMLERMRYEPGERDLLIMQHEFVIAYPEKQEHLTATLLEYGIPGGDSAMARTVGLPAAIAAHHLLEGQWRHPGVLIPTLPELYEPVLEALETYGIRFEEHLQEIQV